MWGSDHLPILADILSKPTRKKKSFKFDKRWLETDELRHIVLDGWNSLNLSPNATIMDHISSCRKSLSLWKRERNLNSAKMIEELKTKVDNLYSEDGATTEEIAEAVKELNDALKAEKLFWKQKSRVLWLLEGDSNTKFFHAIIKQKRERNKITNLMDSSGTRVEDEEKLEVIATNYFRELFQSSNPQLIAEAIENVSTTITDQINEWLTAAVSEWEVKTTLFMMHPEKAPGPDGFTALFYQKFWDIVKEDLTRMVNEFLFHRIMADGLNDANIFLIPKKDNANEMSQFRPISLCNVSYKIMSKVLCQRMKAILPDRISETQSAFVVGRQITDNVLIAQEMFHALRTSNGGRKRRMAIKTDMSKAYDRLEWEFISAIMEKMGFSNTWVEWIMRCVTSIKYHVLFNSQPRGNIIPHRGLRQGDPLSPFIFILCREELVSLLNHAESEGRITGMRVSRASPPIYHLLFADDSLFFCKAESRECDEIMKMLAIYGKASGQCINFAKSSLLFGKRIPGNVKQSIMTSTGIPNEGGMGTYLGIPEDISGSKIRLFAFLRDKLKNRVNGWTGRWLSKGGKEVLIKSIMLALPTYVMSTFLLPLEICENLVSAIAQFWWSSNLPKRGLHWVKWGKMCLPREKEVVEVSKISNIITRKSSTRTILSIYSPLRVTEVRNPSYGWTSIMAANPLISMGIRQKVHSGNEIRIWEDLWIPTIPARPARPIASVLHPMMSARDLMSGNPKRWDTELLERYIHQDDIQLIQSLAICQDYHWDEYCWSYTTNGMYTVKSGYWVATNILNKTTLTNEPSITKLQDFAWKISAPPKIKHLMWQTISGQLAVTSNLIHRHMRCDNHSPRCGAENETINHALFECPPSLQTWAHANTPTPLALFPSTSHFTNMDYLFWRKNDIEDPDLDMDPYPWILWYIWKARNEKLFKGINKDPLETVRNAKAECQAWFSANKKPERRVVMQNNGVDSTYARCQIDGSWTHDALFSGCGWTLINSRGETQLIGAKNQQRRISPLHTELEDLSWAMDCMIQNSHCQAFETDCKELIKMIQEPDVWPNFSTELKEVQKLKERFTAFSISYVPRERNVLSDSLAKLARSFHRDLYYIGCSISVWFSRPPQV